MRWASRRYDECCSGITIFPSPPTAAANRRLIYSGSLPLIDSLLPRDFSEPSPRDMVTALRGGADYGGFRRQRAQAAEPAVRDNRTCRVDRRACRRQPASARPQHGPDRGFPNQRRRRLERSRRARDVVQPSRQRTPQRDTKVRQSQARPAPADGRSPSNSREPAGTGKTDRAIAQYAQGSS